MSLANKRALSNLWGLYGGYGVGIWTRIYTYAFWSEFTLSKAAVYKTVAKLDNVHYHMHSATQTTSVIRILWKGTTKALMRLCKRGTCSVPVQCIFDGGRLRTLRLNVSRLHSNSKDPGYYADTYAAFCNAILCVTKCSLGIRIISSEFLRYEMQPRYPHNLFRIFALRNAA